MTGTPALNYPYDHVELTHEINVIPNTYGRLTERNVFPVQATASTKVEIGFENGVLHILEPGERGQTKPTIDKSGDEHSVIVKVPHIPHTASIKAADLQDRYVFGSARQQLRSVDTETAKTLANLRRKHAITGEFLRVGALKGLIVSGKGTEIYNLFDVFKVQPRVYDLDLGNANSDLLGKLDKIRDETEVSLEGEVMDGIEVQISRDLMQRIVAHPNVEKLYLGHQAATALAEPAVRDRFTVNGITFEVYNGVAPDISGVARKFIESGAGYGRPTGTQETFGTYCAPPDHVDFANAMMEYEIFVSPKVLDHGKGIEFHSESNILPICRRPKVLFKVHSTT